MFLRDAMAWSVDAYLGAWHGVQRFIRAILYMLVGRACREQAFFNDSGL